MKLALPRSIFGQLLVAQLALLALLALGLPVLVLTTLRETADELVARRLSHDAEMIAAGLGHGGPPGPPPFGWLRTPFAPPRGMFRGPPIDGRAYRALAIDGHVLAQGGQPLVLARLAGSPGHRLRHERIGHTDIYRRAFPGGIVEVAQDRSHPEAIVDDVVASFLRRVLWIIPLILAGSTAAGLLVVRRVTRQLRRASAAADAIRPSALDTRLDVSPLPREAQGLAAAANRALDRLAESHRRQGQFVANVAHELRTPMALIALRADALPPGPARDRLREAVDQASHVVSQLMELAQLEHRPPAVEPIDLGMVAREAAEAAAPLVYRSGRSIEVAAAPAAAACARGNAGLLRIALGNLIDNAVRHTPEGTHIRLDAAATTVTVSDDGPGFVADGAGGFRSAGSARSDSAGLGLAIVQRIMSAMGGTVAVLAEGPGARVALRLAAVD